MRQVQLAALCVFVGADVAAIALLCCNLHTDPRLEVWRCRYCRWRVSSCVGDCKRGMLRFMHAPQHMLAARHSETVLSKFDTMRWENGWHTSALTASVCGNVSMS